MGATPRRSSSAPRLLVARAASAAAVVLTVVVGLVVAAAPASAATYRYWGFYQLSGTAWTFATKGPDQVTPTDGSVEGWRYAITGENDVRQPRAVLTFDAICATTPAVSGKKRVGVVLDYGRPADSDGATAPAPRAACAVVDADSSSAAVLAAVTKVRAEKGLVCAIDGWPATGCGDEVKNPSDQAKAKDDVVTIAAAPPTPAGTTPTGTAPAASQPAASQPAEQSSGTNNLGLIVVLLGAAVAALVITRRRRASSQD